MPPRHRMTVHQRSLCDRLWSYVQRRAVLRGTGRSTDAIDRKIADVTERMRQQGMTPIEVEIELAEAEENARSLEKTLYANTAYAGQQTLLDALQAVKNAAQGHPAAVFLDIAFSPATVVTGDELVTTCWPTLSVGASNDGRRVIPDQLYWLAPVYNGFTVADAADFEWFLAKWGHLPWVLVVSPDPACIREANAEPGAESATSLRDLVGRLRPSRFAVERVLIGLMYPMEGYEAMQMAEDALAVFGSWGEPVDPSAYDELAERLISVLWEVEQEDPMEFLAALEESIAERMGMEPTPEVLEYVHAALQAVNVRHLYESRWGGRYRIEPDDSIREMPRFETNDEIDRYMDGLETRPVALFTVDPDVLETALDDPAIRAIYASHLRSNRRR